MSSKKSGVEPLGARDASARVRAILDGGSVTFSRHARERLEEHDLAETDVVNVLRAGKMIEPAEFERGTERSIGSWRYRFHTERICVVLSFRSPQELVVVTTWRKRVRGR